MTMGWSAHANEQMAFVKDSANATPAEMGQLLSQMNAWAANNPDSRHFIEFGKLRHHGVAFTVSGGDIVSVDYGDRD
ncbi:hypothetical protein [Paracoccus aminovorans]|uniref:hypothetical protein n=1 Tax=Paracoccus aminovorans TaxID=34004 RepID=UPI002B2613C1|nr:hypothetical protein [Paracoccus aminovorans]